jgi:hypothetical protein
MIRLLSRLQREAAANPLATDLKRQQPKQHRPQAAVFGKDQHHSTKILGSCTLVGAPV